MRLSTNRRHFLRQTCVWASASVLASRPRVYAANERLRTAHIGVGGMGGADLNSIASHSAVEVAALCDVDRSRLQAALTRFPNAKPFADYRELIDQLGNTIDAVVVSTPDHTHAPAAMMALNAGKPVYCQKPLTHQIFEARQLRLAAEGRGLVTQMGIQVHSAAPYRQAVAMIQSGVIGRVSQVHAWSSKNWGYDGGPAGGQQAVPEGLEWNLWLGTAAERPYVPNIYHPQLAQVDRLRHRHAGRHGRSHL